MHIHSMEAMEKFLGELDRDKPLKILDVGSRVVDDQAECYWNLISNKWEYTGLDIEDGENVDIISTNPYSYPLETEGFDVIISGQTLEHIPNPWQWIKELYRLLKTGGWICIIAPSVWVEHKYPIDCWRILPDGMKALFDYAGFIVVDIYNQGTGNEIDCVGVGKK